MKKTGPKDTGGAAVKKPMTLALKTMIALSLMCAAVLATVVFSYKDEIFALTGFFWNEALPASAATDGQTGLVTSEAAMMEEAVNSDKIYGNIYINNVSVSGMTMEEAVAFLNEQFGSVGDNTVSLNFGGERYVEQFSSFGVAYNIEETVLEAYRYGRNGSVNERFQEIMRIKENPVRLELKRSFDDSKLEALAEAYAGKLDILPTEPEFLRTDGEFVARPGIDGRAVDKELLRRDIAEIINRGQSGEADIIAQTVSPKYKASDFEKATQLLGTFSTNFVVGETNRNQNISTAASKINNYVLMPGETFSTNKAFGAVTYENGYRMAGTYLNGRIVDGMGGGMCQVSTTLYNALLYAEANIVERTNHSMKVGYADYAYDATLAGDYIDLKFKNDTDYPITIESVLTNKSITVNIYGYETRSPSRTLKFESALVSTTQPEAELISYDPNLWLNQRVVDVAPKMGYKYQLYKFVYENGTLTDKVLVNTSTYRPVRGEVRIGTGPQQPAPEVTAPAAVVAEAPLVMPEVQPEPPNEQLDVQAEQTNEQRDIQPEQGPLMPQ